MEENPYREDQRLPRRRRQMKLTERIVWCFHLQVPPRVRISDDQQQSEPYKNYLLCGKRLFHQLLVHIWSCILSSRLDWLRKHNSLFRCDYRAGVLDVLASDPAIQQGDMTQNNVGHETGRRMALPSFSQGRGVDI